MRGWQGTDFWKTEVKIGEHSKQLESLCKKWIPGTGDFEGLRANSWAELINRFVLPGFCGQTKKPGWEAFAFAA